MVKRAILFGCNYSHLPDYALNGCINDVHSMAAWLKTRGYDQSNIKIIVDDGTTLLRPSRPTIIRELQQIVAESQPGDTVFIHYSGHGGQSWETPEDECDNIDETIYGSGENELQEITDDDLRQTLVDAMKLGVKVRCVFDSCHSASVLDLPFRCVNGKNFIVESSMTRGSDDCLEISGCMDKQTSADAYIGYKYQGALTWAFLESIKAKPNATWLQLVKRIRKLLKSKNYTQVPQLSVCNQSIVKSPVDV